MICKGKTFRNCVNFFVLFCLFFLYKKEVKSGTCLTKLQIKVKFVRYEKIRLKVLRILNHKFDFLKHKKYEVKIALFITKKKNQEKYSEKVRIEIFSTIQ